MQAQLAFGVLCKIFKNKKNFGRAWKLQTRREPFISSFYQYQKMLNGEGKDQNTLDIWLRRS